MCAYRKAILTISMQFHAMSLHTIWSIWVINKCQSGIEFFLPASAQYNFSFMNIGALSSISRKNTMMKVKLLQSVHAGMSTRG